MHSKYMYFLVLITTGNYSIYGYGYSFSAMVYHAVYA